MKEERKGVEESQASSTQTTNKLFVNVKRSRFTSRSAGGLSEQNMENKTHTRTQKKTLVDSCQFEQLSSSEGKQWG